MARAKSYAKKVARAMAYAEKVGVRGHELGA